MLFFLLGFIWHSLSSDREDEQAQKERRTELLKEIDIQNFELRMIEKILNFASFEVIRIRRIERLEKSLEKELNQKVISRFLYTSNRNRRSYFDFNLSFYV